MRRGTNSLQFIRLLNKTKRAQRSLGWAGRTEMQSHWGWGRREGGSEWGRSWMGLIKKNKKSCFGGLTVLWLFGCLDFWTAATALLKFHQNRTNPPSGHPPSGALARTTSCEGGQSGGTALKEWKWPQRAWLQRSLSLTHSAPCIFSSTSTKKRDISPLPGPFSPLKDSPA